MAHLLVATVPLAGHVTPMALLVRALVARGHAVTWSCSAEHAAAIEATGARCAVYPWREPDLGARTGIARAKRQISELFIAPIPDQLAALEALGGDAILADNAHLGAALYAERHGVPWIGLGISALMPPSIDTAPFGSALPPGNPGRNKFLNWLVFRAMFRGVNARYRAARVAAGLPAGEGTYFDVLSPDLFLQATIPAFEYPRSDLAPQVRFIGPLLPRASAAALPAWWPDLAGGRPIVLVTQGTLATDPRALIAPALAGLAGEDVLVVATTDLTGPDNARTAPFVPFAPLMPRLAAMVTNGGYGGVQLALAHGVPLVVAGGTEEKPEIAARVAWSGAGLDLRTGRPKPAAIRRAVRRVLDEPQFRARARELAAEMATHDACAEGVALIEQLLGTRAMRRAAR